MKTYRVLREHEGDRVYRRGDTRRAEPSDVLHLVRLGVLEEDDSGMVRRLDAWANVTPSTPAVQNKAERPPKTKA